MPPRKVNTQDKLLWDGLYLTVFKPTKRFVKWNQEKQAISVNVSVSIYGQLAGP